MWPVDAEPYNCLSILLTEAASDRTTTCASQKSRFRTSLLLKKKLKEGILLGNEHVSETRVL